MAFKGNEDHSITLSAASALTTNYRDASETEAIKGGFFGKSAIQKILDQQECVGIRFYYGQEEDGTSAIVLVGVSMKMKMISLKENLLRLLFLVHRAVVLPMT